MCNPAAAGLFISLAVTAYQINSQENADIKKQKYQDQLSQDGKKAAFKAYGASVAQELNQQSQQDAALSQKIQQNSKAAAQARATARVAAGEAGVSGLSVDQLLSDFDRQESLNNQSYEQNRAYGRQQLDYNIMGHAAQRDSRYAQYTFQPVNHSYVGDALQFTGAAVGAANGYYDATHSRSGSE